MSSETVRAGAKAPWAPPPDDELTWLRYEGVLPSRPRPLELSLVVEAFRYGLGHALDSLNFPLHSVRARLFDGQLYLAPVPSAMAEGDLDRRMRRMRDATLRFSRNIRASWERSIRQEVEEYNERLAAFAPADATPTEIAEGLFGFKRLRANQWFAPIRAVIAPAAMSQAGIGETPPDDAVPVVQEVRDLVITQGTARFDAAIGRVAERLTKAGHVDDQDDVYWLEYSELTDALTGSAPLQPVIASRRTSARTTSAEGPVTIGPALPPDAPRMYLFREVLALLK
jgi:hypothetical protein